MDYARLVKEIDPMLDNPEYRRRLYAKAGVSIPATLKMTWRMFYLDLRLFDEATDTFFVLRKAAI